MSSTLSDLITHPYFALPLTWLMVLFLGAVLHATDTILPLGQADWVIFWMLVIFGLFATAHTAAVRQGWIRYE